VKRVYTLQNVVQKKNCSVLRFTITKVWLKLSFKKCVHDVQFILFVSYVYSGVQFAFVVSVHSTTMVAVVFVRQPRCAAAVSVPLAVFRM
jgi:hypothetical protein